MDSMNRETRLHPIVGSAILAFLVLIVFGVGLLCAEVYIRSRAFNGYCVWPQNMDQTLSPKTEIMPGVNGKSRFTTNEYGIRGRNFARGDDYRILAVGGSTTECVFLDDSETWPHLLGVYLGDRLRSTKVWVGNAGNSGTTTANYIEVMEKALPQLPSIDAVVLLVGINDLSFRLSHNESWKPRSQLPGGKRPLRKPTFLVIPRTIEPVHKLPEVKSRIDILQQKLHDEEPPPRQEFEIDAEGVVYDKWRKNRQTSKRRINAMPDISAALAEYEENLTTIIQLGEEQGVRVIFVTQPTLWHRDMPEYLRSLLWYGGVGRFQETRSRPYFTAEILERVMNEYNDVVTKLCETEDVEYVDLAGIVPKDTTVFYDDCHFNESGARKVAAELSEFFLTTDPLRDRVRD